MRLTYVRCLTASRPTFRLHQLSLQNPDVALLISWIGWRFALALYPAFFIIVVVGVVALSRRLLAVATAMVVGLIYS